MSSATLVHLIYIHGFRGDNTTYQSFPTDLHRLLSSLLPSNLELHSCLYPTYKSKRPIAEATHNFLEWLSTLPTGHVILAGHSMGGLLVAEAATSSHAQSKRIIGLLAFDTPYLGMHPHVVISGIASLFPNKDARSEKRMNDSSDVSFVGSSILDEQDDERTSSRGAPNASSSSSLSPSPSPSIASSLSPTLVPDASSPSKPLTFFHRTAALLLKHADDPFVKFLRKHQKEPLAAMERWVVQHFQFGICMFDPAGLMARYRTLENWDGQWINYWTDTAPRLKEKKQQSAESHTPIPSPTAELEAEFAMTTMEQNASIFKQTVTSADELLTSDPGSDNQLAEILDPTPMYGPRSRSEQKAYDKAQVKMLKRLEKETIKDQKNKTPKVIPPRHFIVLPLVFGIDFGSERKWEKVVVKGAMDEVEAHCGLFMRDKNTESIT